VIYRKNALWMSLAAALFASASAMAQDAGTAAQQPATQQPATAQNQADAKKVQQLEGVTVTGIRASLQKSLDLKRNSDSIVDAISAEDVGKFPDTNVAGQALNWQGVDRFNLRGDRMYKGQVYWDTRRVAEQMAEAVKRAQQGGSSA